MKKLFVLLGVSLVVAIGFCGCGKEAEARAEAKAKDEAKARAKEKAKARARAEAEAEAGETLRTGVVTLPGDVSLKMIKVEPGSFMMGSENGRSNEKPVHRVTLTKPYYLGETEVTQAQWRAVMGTTVEEQRDKAYTSWSLRGVGDNNPIYYVNWHEAIAFCQKLNEQGKAPKGWKFTLPTEAQWEYAARGGNKSKDYTYSGSNDINKVAWYYDNSGLQTHDVGGRKPNELGFYDMSGNVEEWCLDWYAADYGEGAVIDPQGLDNGSVRVLRGGSWRSIARHCRSAYRSYGSPGYLKYDCGFRLALVPVQ